MRMCQEHWDVLREEVNKQGMGEWVVSDGQTLIDQIVHQAQHGEQPVNYDPLMSCWMMIVARTTDMVGLAALDPEFGCPICFFNSKRNPDGSCPCGQPECGAKEPGTIPPFEEWIAGPKSCVVAAREHMEEQGWLS